MQWEFDEKLSSRSSTQTEWIDSSSGSLGFGSAKNTV